MGFAIPDDHLHLLVRLDPDAAQGWSDADVVRRWGRLFAPRDKARQAAPVSDEWVQTRLKDPTWVATVRQRLLTAAQPRGAEREGMIEGFSLGNYLILVEYTGRLFREGKAVISSELAVIFERLGCSADNWQARLQSWPRAGCWAVPSPSVAAGCGKSPTV